MADYDLQYQDTYIDGLLATANELKTAGYIYKGVATPSTNPGTPTERVAYLASEPGTYTNFGGIVIASGLYSLTYASGTWTGTQMQAGSDIEVVQTTGQSTGAVMSQKAVTENLQIREEVRDLFYDDFGNIVYNSSGQSSPAIQNKRISSLQYFTSGDAGDSIKLNDNNLKIFIWVRKSASEFEPYLAGDGWTTNDVDIPSNINYYITLAWTDNAQILPASVAYPDAINVTKRIIVKDSQSITEEINNTIFFDEPNVLSAGDYGNFVYNKNAQVTSAAIRITTYNYISTGENSHILHLIDNNFRFFVWYRISSSELIMGTNWTTQDFVIPPHVDYYLTIANSANTNINPSLYYVVERHVMPKSRLTDIYNKLNKLSTHNIVWTQWNVGQFARGAGAPNITPSTYNSMAIRWNDEVADEYAKVFGMIEYNPVFGKNVDNVDVSPDDVVWHDYPYKAIFRQPQTASYWGGTAILSQIALSNAEKIKYTCYEGVVAPDPTTQHMIDEVAFMTVADMTYMGVVIKVVETSTAYNFSNRADNTYQRMAYQELVSRFGNEPYVIISGDFECVDKEDYDIFADAGFSLCNGGDFGWFNTCMTPLTDTVTELDNIIVKGFDVEDVVVRYNDLSDHFPLIAMLKIKS